MKVLITRPRSQADDFAEKLRQAGFEPVLFPVIEIEQVENNTELANAISNIQKYSWIVFTSANAVDVVARNGALAQSTRENGLKFAAVGPKTADALRKHDIEPHFIPDEYVGEAILSGLGDVKDKWILLPRAEIARAELPEAIVCAGGIAHEIVVYKTLPAEIDMEGLKELEAGVDVVTFTSASTVENFVSLVRKYKLDPLHLQNDPAFICIGPITEQAAREAGLQKVLVAKEYTTDGLIEAIKTLEVL